VGYISTGGGAFLEVLEGKTLPAFEILQRARKGDCSPLSGCQGQAACQRPGWSGLIPPTRVEAASAGPDRRARVRAYLRRPRIRRVNARGDTMQPKLSAAEQALRDAALEYHRSPTRGKIAVTPTKPLSNQRDLSLAYSPGVAYACLAIEEDPTLAAEYTSRGNLVGVVTNGTAVLGLGDIGPLAGKPVMEGKGCLFKKFAGIDVFDIELAERDPDKLVDIIAALEPTLGGVNLEDIKAPECFYIEKKLRERMNIPVFHDDQHGTAIISAAACSTGWNWWASASAR
jgi:hypothetical protein